MPHRYQCAKQLACKSHETSGIVFFAMNASLIYDFQFVSFKVRKAVLSTKNLCESTVQITARRQRSTRQTREARE